MSDYFCYRCSDAGCSACSPFFTPNEIHTLCGHKWSEHTEMTATQKAWDEAAKHGYTPTYKCPEQVLEKP